MKILIIGAAGMVGQKLIQKLTLENENSDQISNLILQDIVPVRKPDTSINTNVLISDISRESDTAKLVEMKPDIIFHLASVVSGEAEQDFDKGWLMNTRATWYLLEKIREASIATGGIYTPKLIFTSSIAVFGPPFPETIGDDFLCAPQTSYGAQKAVNEMLINDYSRKGFVHGVSIRLPTICVRPGKPNRAASSFFSNIIREPLNGLEAVLPVSKDVRHWHASPRSAANFLVHCLALNPNELGNRRSLNMPGVSCTVEEQIEALRSIAGNKVVSLIRKEPDEMIIRIVDGWPRNFETTRSEALGFSAETDFTEIIKVYISDDLVKP